MTIKELMLEEIGSEGYRKLSADLRALFRKIDSLPPLSLRPAPRTARRRSA